MTPDSISNELAAGLVRERRSDSVRGRTTAVIRSLRLWRSCMNTSDFCQSVHQPTMLQLLHCLLLASAVLLCNTAPTPTEKHGGLDTKCPLMVKILDAVKGTPAGSVALKVFQRTANGSWTRIANGVTDATGEIHDLITEQQIPAGVYRVEFDTKAYWKSEGSTPFHEVADVVFEVHAEGHRHYTLALLLSPFSYTTTAVVTDLHQ